MKGPTLKALASLLLIVLIQLPAAAAEPSVACAAKRTNIEAQISEAKAHGNRQQLAGLNSALRANKRHCTDASLEADRKRDIASAEKKVVRRQADLEKAQAKGDVKKIAKEQAQLDAATAALAELRK